MDVFHGKMPLFVIPGRSSVEPPCKANRKLQWFHNWDFFYVIPCSSLSSTYTELKRKRKRKFSLMFGIFSLILFTSSLIFLLSLPLSLDVNRPLMADHCWLVRSIRFCRLLIHLDTYFESSVSWIYLMSEIPY